MADPDTATEKKTLLELGEVIAEGESARGGYDAYNAGNKATGAGGKAGRVLHSGVKDLSAFTVDQILASSDSLTGRDARRIFAAGKYQVITDTLRAAKAHLGLTGSERFTPALQEKIFVQYLIGKKRPEIGAYITRGVGTSEDATYAAAKEWASIEVPAGRRISAKRGGLISNGRLSFYQAPGVNSAKAGSGVKTKTALERARAAFAGGKGDGGGGLDQLDQLEPIGGGEVVASEGAGAGASLGGELEAGAAVEGTFSVDVSVSELTPVGPGHLIAGSVGRSGRNHHHDVGVIQRALAARGHDPGPIDHKVGPRTIGAIVGFQRGFMRRPDGLIEVGRVTEQHLAHGLPAPGGDAASVTAEVDLEGQVEAGAGLGVELAADDGVAGAELAGGGVAAQDEVTQAAGDLASLMARGRLSAAELALARRLIAAEPRATRPALYRALQGKVVYANQRDNQATLHGARIEAPSGTMCNLTSLAMCLQYLGIPNPHPAMQYEDALERVRQERGFAARTDPKGWSAVARALGAEVDMLSWGGARDRTWWTGTVGAALAAGRSVMCSITGHIVRVQAVQADGVVVDDPYGKRALLPGGKGRWRHLGANTGANPSAGEDVTWTWDQVEPHLFLWVASFSR
ncbi:MAG: peptidoglycan-binding protein [Kofleriaceae bacterium]|nr:peptidoglycan-binding protein [Kofleriaceae bacterium]MBP9202727.1 peptidoglycan-binding protein [Kofleriaceae bacterium]